jgi:hypothetical protein
MVNRKPAGPATKSKNRQVFRVVIGAALCFAVLVGSAAANTDTLTAMIQWTVAEGGNGHWYAFLPAKMTWDQARIAAGQFTKDGVPGHLATITSSQETDFAFRTISFDPMNPVGRIGNHWLGGYDDTVWTWVTGEPMIYTDWAPGQPTNAEIHPALAMVGPPWIDCALCPQPSQWVDLARTLTLSSIIEFDTEPIEPSEPRTLYVPDEFPTIQLAIDSANNGDLVLVSPGTYHESLNYHGKNITVRSTDGPLVTTITNERTVDLATFENGETTDAVLDGFTLSGGWIAIMISSSTITHNICVSQNVSNWAAICIAGPIQRSTDPNGDPRYHANLGYAPAVIENNTIINSTNGGISMFSITPPTIRNNIIAFNANYGIHQQSLTAQEPPIMGYNDVYGQGEFDGGPHGNYINIPNPGPGAISADPLLCRGYELTVGSPCINAGDPDSIYNDPDGSRNDMGAVPYDGSGTIEEPDTLYVPAEFPTIQLAIDSANNGDLVLVYPGTYYESINFLGKNITVRGADGPLQTTITNERTVTLVSFDHGETHDAVLEGFTLSGGWIAVMCANSAPTIRHNICVRQNVWNWAAICLSGPLDTIGDQTGDPRYHANLGYAPAVIENNTIVNSTNGGISMFSITPPTIRNNIVAFNANYGIHQQSLSDQEPPIMGYNDVYGQGEFDGGPHGDYINIPDPGPGAIRTDPLFEQELFAPVWTLSQESPCINAGDPDPVYNDFDGTRNDMGAMPYVQTPGGGVIPTNEWIAIYCNDLELPEPHTTCPSSIIQAFDPSGVLCGEAYMTWGTNYGLMPIYRDDPYTEIDEGCEPGDSVILKINGQEVVSSPQVYWTANGDVFEVCNFFANQCQDIPLHAGWNLISWNVAFESEINTALDEIIGCVDVVQSFEGGGLTFDPNLDGYNTLTNLDYHHAYWIRMNCDAVLQVCGNPIPSDEYITLIPGWNLVSYWPETSLPVETGFTSIIDSLQIAMGFDNGAQIWLPSLWGNNTLTELRPTFGYWVRVPGYMALMYSDYYYPDSVITFPPGSGEPEPSLTETSRDWMSVYGTNITVDGQPVADGAAIEFYVDGTVLCGRGIYSGNALKLTPVYGSDATGEVSKYYAREGDVLETRIDGERVYPDLVWAGSSSRVQLGRLTTDSRGLPTSYALEQNYPNPFNPGTMIAFEIMSDGPVSLAIYNVLGQKVRTLAEGQYGVGRYRMEWDGCDDGGNRLSTGIYLYRLTAGETVLTKKMLMMK